MHCCSSKTLVGIENLGFKVKHKNILNKINCKIEAGQVYAIVGASGSGKTILAEIISGELNPSEGEVLVENGINLAYVPQQDHFISDSGIRISYYGQRYENPDEEGIPTVTEFCSRIIPNFCAASFNTLLSDFNVSYLSDRKILSLSNGERKRVQLVVAFSKNSDVMILDQPYTGLDVKSREMLNQIIEKKKTEGKSFVIVCNPYSIPTYTDTVWALKKGALFQQFTRNDFFSQKQGNEEELIANPFPEELVRSANKYEFVVRMKDVNVSYGKEKVLSNINWEIKTGDRWALRGHNGAGKSTLLSLITADNPQGYSNDLILFDRQRGSGETVWDIKSKIGFVSPELHLYFLRRRGLSKTASGARVSAGSLSCLDVVLSGFKDEVGQNTTHSKLQIDWAKKWLRLLDMEELADAPFVFSSLGEQRIIMLVRALVKSPGLLVLDEPCQGLDPGQVRRFTTLLDNICASNPVTLIYVTHHSEQIPSCVNLTLQLEHGRTL